MNEEGTERIPVPFLYDELVADSESQVGREGLGYVRL
jgi:hypothetical protein